MDYCDVFISCHSDGTHSLQSIHWWASDAMLFLQIWWRNKLIHILDDQRVSKPFLHITAQTSSFSYERQHISLHQVHRRVSLFLTLQEFTISSGTDRGWMWGCHGNGFLWGNRGQALQEPRAIHGFPLISPQTPESKCSRWHIEQLITDPRFTYFGCVDPSRRFTSRRHLLSSSSRTASHVGLLKDRRQPE